MQILDKRCFRNDSCKYLHKKCEKGKNIKVLEKNKENKENKIKSNIKLDDNPQTEVLETVEMEIDVIEKVEEKAESEIVNDNSINNNEKVTQLKEMIASKDVMIKVLEAKLLTLKTDKDEQHDYMKRVKQVMSAMANRTKELESKKC